MRDRLFLLFGIICIVVGIIILVYFSTEAILLMFGWSVIYTGFVFVILNIAARRSPLQELSPLKAVFILLQTIAPIFIINGVFAGSLTGLLLAAIGAVLQGVAIFVFSRFHKQDSPASTPPAQSTTLPWAWAGILLAALLISFGLYQMEFGISYISLAAGGFLMVASTVVFVRSRKRQIQAGIVDPIGITRYILIVVWTVSIIPISSAVSDGLALLVIKPLIGLLGEQSRQILEALTGGIFPLVFWGMVYPVLKTFSSLPTGSTRDATLK